MPRPKPEQEARTPGSAVGSLPHGSQSGPEQLTQQLVDEFRGQLEESLVRAIVLDYDIAVSYNVIREQLRPLAESATGEEEAAFQAELLDGLEHLRLDSEGAATNADTVLSRPSTAHSGRTELTAPNSQAEDSAETESAGEILAVDDEDKVTYLKQIFPDVRKHTIRFVLRGSDGDVGRATEELLSREAMETEGMLPKGIDGFFRPDEEPTPIKDSRPSLEANSAALSRLRIEYSVVSSNSSGEEELEGVNGLVKPRPRSQLLSVGPSSAAPSPHFKPLPAAALASGPRRPPLTSVSATEIPTTKKDPYQWQTVTGKQKKTTRSKSADRASPTLDAHTLAANKRLIATNHYRAVVAASQRAGSDPLARQAVAVRLEQYRAATRIANQAASASYELLVDERSRHNLIDLHYLPVREGVRVAMERAQQWWEALPGENRAATARESGGFVVITGQGRHNRDGKSRLREDVFAALKGAGWLMTKETGQFVVTGRSR